MKMMLLALVFGLGDITPTPQTLVYYNARMALREGRPAEAVKLWLLRNTIESETRKISAHDDDFRSVTWAALGGMGICLDGFAKDQAGAGLWPVAKHNWIVKNMNRRNPPWGGVPFDAFELGRQRRAISIHDILDAAELRALRLRAGPCSSLRAGGARNKTVTARRLRRLLREALTTMAPGRTKGKAVIEARIFDLNLKLAGLGQKQKTRANRAERIKGRRSGLSKSELEDQQKSGTSAIADDAEAAGILKTSLTWSPDQWMALTADRRQFLYDQAVALYPDHPNSANLELAMVDRLIQAGEGVELAGWIGRYTQGQSDEAIRQIWAGERGARILALDGETGFRERAPIALRRGIDFLSAGRLPEALRSMAHALRWAEFSRGADAVRSLSRRWLSYVAAQFRMTDSTLAMLRTVVPRSDFSAVLEDQLWHATLNADEASFQRCVSHQKGRGALKSRLVLLRPLAEGKNDVFLSLMDETLGTSPYFAMRFVQQLLSRLEVQSADVRVRYVPMLLALKTQLEERASNGDQSKGSLRRFDTAITQIRALVEGVEAVIPNPGDRDKANALSPDQQFYVGSFRVAPSDRPPWPFTIPTPDAPNVFAQLKLEPEEWRGADGRLIFGWRISD